MRPRLDPLRILQVSWGDMGTGASNVAWNLFKAYRDRGHISRLAVSSKRSSESDVRTIPTDSAAGPWSDFWTTAGDALLSVESKIPRGVGPLGRMMNEMAFPKRMLNRWQGIEDFDYPGSWHILDLWPDRPDVVQCHTLHGGYFDFRALPWLSSQVPVAITLHDAWFLSGHCAHSLSCERWKTGCGRCPDLTLSPAMRRDATAYNWERKREIYRKSRLYLATPSKWLMKKIKESILMEAAVDLRVIPNGVDLSIWRPADKATVRSKMGLPVDSKILLFAAIPALLNSYKDYPTVRAAGLRVGGRLRGERVLVLTVGEDAPPERIGNVEFRFVPPQYDPGVMASYYQAADIYVHGAHAETFSLAMIEAMACGKPTVGTAVGGIPEIIEDGKTGYLVPHQDAETMADRVEELLTDSTKLKRFEENALEGAQRFDLNRQADEYQRWFAQIAGKS